MSKNNIGETIKKYRTMTQFTQAELAEELSKLNGKTVAPSAITGYECGQRIPKVEVREQIAQILQVDPVAMSGLELTEVDEKRLLCKLLYKYAISLDLEEDGNVKAMLSDDFADFQMEHEAYLKNLPVPEYDGPEGSMSYEVTKRSAQDEMEFWLEMYPAYDAASLAKERHEDCDIEKIKAEREFIQGDKNIEFFDYQDNYLTPKMNQELVEKLRNKKA